MLDVKTTGHLLDGVQTISRTGGTSTWAGRIYDIPDAWVNPGQPNPNSSPYISSPYISSPYSGSYGLHGPDSSLAAFLGFYRTLDMFDAILVHRKLFAGESNEVVAKHFGMSSDAVRKHFLHIIERAGFAGFCSGNCASDRRCFNFADVAHAYPIVLPFTGTSNSKLPPVEDVTRENCLEKLSAVVLAKYPDARPWEILFSHYNTCFVSMLLDEITLWRSKPYNDSNMIWGGRFA